MGISARKPWAAHLEPIPTGLHLGERKATVDIRCRLGNWVMNRTGKQLN
jgi:hypothetical protein